MTGHLPRPTAMPDFPFTQAPRTRCVNACWYSKAVDRARMNGWTNHDKANANVPYDIDVTLYDTDHEEKIQASDRMCNTQLQGANRQQSQTRSRENYQKQEEPDLVPDQTNKLMRNEKTANRKPLSLSKNDFGGAQKKKKKH